MNNKIDKLGRIVIPINLRRKYGITTETELKFIESDGGISIFTPTKLCRICQNNIAEKDFPICKKCTEEIKKRI